MGGGEGCGDGPFQIHHKDLATAWTRSPSGREEEGEGVAFSDHEADISQ